MSETAEKPKRMCSHCRVNPVSNWYRGVPYSYCSFECSAIGTYPKAAPAAFCFSFIFILYVIGLSRALMGLLPLDIWLVAQFAFVGFFFVFFNAMTIIGYRGTKEEKLKTTESPDTM